MNSFNQREYQTMVLGALLSGINHQPEASEVFIKGKAGNIVKDVGYYDIRDRVTERKALIPGKFFINLLCFQPDRSVISNNEKFRPDYINKLNRKVIAGAVSEKGDGFADNIPCSIKYNLMFCAIFKKFYCPVMVGVVGR